ncbi:MAG: hypothetical protein ACI35S_09055 [Anaeroplasma sp.]
MKYSIGQTISKAIKENKWLSIDYINTEGKESTFWCSIIDIDINNKGLIIDIFNIFKSNKVINNGYINFDRIKNAKVLEGTYYSYDSLDKKIEKNITKLSWLEFSNFNDKILEYYSEAKRLDIDPYQNDYLNVSGIDARILSETKNSLSDEQFEIIVKDIYKNEDIEKTNKFSQLAINKFSISINNKIYVVAYFPLILDVKAKELIVNKSFLINENKFSLSTYITMNPDEYIQLLHTNYDETKDCLRENLFIIYNEKIYIYFICINYFINFLQ